MHVTDILIANSLFLTAVLLIQVAAFFARNGKASKKEDKKVKEDISRIKKQISN